MADKNWSEVNKDKWDSTVAEFKGGYKCGDVEIRVWKGVEVVTDDGAIETMLEGVDESEYDFDPTFVVEVLEDDTLIDQEAAKNSSHAWEVADNFQDSYSS